MNSAQDNVTEICILKFSFCNKILHLPAGNGRSDMVGELIIIFSLNNINDEILRTCHFLCPLSSCRC